MDLEKQRKYCVFYSTENQNKVRGGELHKRFVSEGDGAGSL